MAPTQTTPRLAYGMAEAAQATGLSRAYLYKLANERQLNLVKIGRRTLIPAAELERLVRDGVR